MHRLVNNSHCNSSINKKIVVIIVLYMNNELIHEKSRRFMAKQDYLCSIIHEKRSETHEKCLKSQFFTHAV